MTLTLHSLTSVCIFSIQLPEHFLGFWQGEFVHQSKTSSAGNQELVWEWLTLFPNILLTLPLSLHGEPARGKSRLPVSLFVVCLPPTLVPISPAHLETLRLSQTFPLKDGYRSRYWSDSTYGWYDCFQVFLVHFENISTIWHLYHGYK